MTMTKKQRKRASSSNRRGMAGIALVVAALLCVMLLQSHRLEAKNAAYAQQIAQLNEAIELENVRAEEIEKMPKKKRVVAIGKVQRKDNTFKDGLKDAFIDIRRRFFEKNNIGDADILSIKPVSLTMPPTCGAEMESCMMFR